MSDLQSLFDSKFPHFFKKDKSNLYKVIFEDGVEVSLYDDVIIKYNLGRNKVEKYRVTIKQLYNYVFLVELNNDFNEVKSFSYSDIITKTIKIDY